MSRNYVSETAAAVKYRLMPTPAYKCEDFSEAGLSRYYFDAIDPEEQEGKPDFLCRQAHTFTFIEHKSGRLNNHRNHESSRAALQVECEYRLYRYFDKPMPHRFLSGLLWDADKGHVVQDTAWNQSIFKLLALQAKHGWRKYIVSFASNPKPEDAERYCKAGLVWCTDKTLPQLLIRIELEALGLSGTFVHTAMKFRNEVTFDDGSATEDDYRTQYLATLAADEAAEAAAAEAAFGQEPF